MKLEDVLMHSSCGVLVTNKGFEVVWANQFEEKYYKVPLQELIGRYVVDCHKEKNKAPIESFLQKFQTGELKEFTKKAHGMVITYSSYQENGEFAGIVRTRIRMPASE